MGKKITKFNVIYYSFLIFTVLYTSTCASQHQIKFQDSRYTDRIIQIKFRDSSVVRLRNGEPATLSGYALTDDASRRLMSYVRRGQWFRLFGTEEKILDQLRLDAEKYSGHKLPDLNNWFALEVSPDLDVEQVIERFSDLMEIEHATKLPKLALPPQVPDFTVPGEDNSDIGNQGYLRRAEENGVDADYAWTLPGGSGDGVTVCDIETNANVGHPELVPVLKIGEPYYTTSATGFDYVSHGTAMLGIVGAKDNGYGVTGIAYSSQLCFISDASDLTANGGFNPVVTPILLAISYTGIGDVILLEQQIPGPNKLPFDGSDKGLVPAEWDPAAFNIITFATALDRIVVEAAGNGSENLDDMIYRDRAFNPFGENRDGEIVDSGAILVGAGKSPLYLDTGRNSGYEKQRIEFSNFGTRIDVQGWGDSILTAGQAISSIDPFLATNPFGPDLTYKTARGTSGAAAIIAGVVASLQGIYMQAHDDTLSPGDMRQLLRVTGSPQKSEYAQFFGDGIIDERIGRLPDIKTAANAIWGELPPLRLDRTSPDGKSVFSISGQLDPDAVTVHLTYNAAIPGPGSEFEMSTQPGLPFVPLRTGYVKARAYLRVSDVVTATSPSIEDLLLGVPGLEIENNPPDAPGTTRVILTSGFISDSPEREIIVTTDNSFPGLDNGLRLTDGEPFELFNESNSEGDVVPLKARILVTIPEQGGGESIILGPVLERSYTKARFN